MKAKNKTIFVFIALLAIPLYSQKMFKQGYNGNVGASYETINENDAALSYLTAADTLEIISTSDNDSTGNTGVRTVTIYGLDGDYALASETVTMAGTDSAMTTNTYLRVYEVVVTTAGSGGVAVGNITLRNHSEGTTTLATIDAGENEWLSASFTVPADKFFRIESMRVTTAQNKISRGALFIREYGGVFIRHGLVELIQGTGEIIFNPPIIAESKADIEIRGLATGGSGTMTASFSGYYGG